MVVKNEPQFADGIVEVKFKPISGKEDEAGGVVWRWKDGDNYYVARANALENNVSLYYTQNGRRNHDQVRRRAGGEEPVAHAARRVRGKRIRVALDGKAYIEADDDHIGGSGLSGFGQRPTASPCSTTSPTHRRRLVDLLRSFLMRVDLRIVFVRVRLRSHQPEALYRCAKSQ